MSKVVDVSHWQGEIDWQKMKSDGVDHAFCKATQGSEDGTAFIDSQLKRNATEGHKAGVEMGAYHYAAFISEEDAKKEADWFLKNIQGLPLALPHVLDMEENRCGSDKEMNKGLRAFLDRVHEKTGHPVMLYSGGYFYLNRIYKDHGYPVWYARYADEPKGCDLNDLALWQHTMKGSIGGISPIDMNTPGGMWKSWEDEKQVIERDRQTKAEVVHADKDQYTIRSGDNYWDLENRWGLAHGTLERLNSDVNPQSLNVGQKIFVPSDVRKGDHNTSHHSSGDTYTVKQGDALSVIAQNHGTSVDRLLELNPGIDDPNVIHTGQKIQLPGGGASHEIYTVQFGDYLSKIGAKFNVNWHDIASLNGIAGPKYTIHPGDKIKIPN
ncbi:GH25 family lysozyme [Tuberibacillus sp. Marseille-P3662]|uniref:GH25 family lysozyme n=1 Tax=Tuberibacillus sp. Marseille-P3662 TaxID=1965358 RepID=UPI000A1CC61D|nr:GH25 family lysozyme [Tuberibacillus sp. Marseille-P3662]